MIELIPGSGWRARVNCCTLGWGFPDRQTAEEYLADLKEQQQRSKDHPMANDELDALRGDAAGAKDADPRVEKLRRQISDIVKLSHSAEPDDAVRYRERQVELRDLTAKLIEAEQGDLADATVEKIGSEWRIMRGKTPLEWRFADRATAQQFLQQLKQPKDIPQ